MLFSNDNIARLVNEGFEPTWQSVRPVPLVTIDFGSGHKATRTLHGNIATYICTPSGHVVDVLPGLYSPDVFLIRLQQLMLAASTAPKSPAGFADWLAKRHAKQAPRQPGAKKSRLDMSKTVVIELPLILALKGFAPEPPADVAKLLESKEELTVWKALVAETQANDTDRRSQIGEFLGESGPIPPAAMTKWLYREVLGADIDDPWLGLKELAEAQVFNQVEAPTLQQ